MHPCFKMTRICLVLTACIPIDCPKWCRGIMAEYGLWQNMIICAETFVRLKPRLWACFCLSTHPDYLRYSSKSWTICLKTVPCLGIYLSLMRRHTKCSTQVLKLRTITCLNDEKRLWMRRCLILLKSEQMHPSRCRVDKTLFPSVFNEKALRTGKGDSYLVNRRGFPSLRTQVLSCRWKLTRIQ